MSQPAFDFSLPLPPFQGSSPIAEPLEAEPPFRGNCPEATHAGWTGVEAVRETWTQRQSAYLQLLNQAGALNDFEAAALLKWNVSSVNSVRNALGDQIVSEGFDAHTFTDASGIERTTRRTRWRIRR